MDPDLVVIRRILCSKLQLSDDDLIRTHTHVMHAFEKCFEVDIIQSPNCSTNQSREHVDVGFQSSILQNTQRRSCEKARKQPRTAGV